MRFSLAVVALSVCLWPLTGLHAGDTAVPHPVTAPATPPPAPIGDSADAVRHAKRTGCIKEARAKKLIGAQKSQYIRECLAAP